MEDFTPIQLRVLVALAAGKSNVEAAAEAGISVACIKKWKQHPKFKKALFEASSKLFDVTIAQLALASSKSVEILIEIIQDPDAHDKTRVSAISILLSYAMKAREFLLESRLARVEEALARDTGNAQD